MTEPTKGPWTFCGADRGGCKCGQVWGNDHLVAIATCIDNMDDIDSQEVCVQSLDEMKANMRLIGAAREMLAALQHAATALAYANNCAIEELAIQELDDDSAYQEPLDMVRGAIAKARGES